MAHASAASGGGLFLPSISHRGMHLFVVLSFPTRVPHQVRDKLRRESIKMEVDPRFRGDDKTLYNRVLLLQLPPFLY